MCDGGSELTRGKFPGQGVEWAGILAEEIDVEDGFGIGQVQMGEIRVDAGVWRAEIGNSGRSTDASSDL